MIGKKTKLNRRKNTMKKFWAVLLAALIGLLSLMAAASAETAGLKAGDTLTFGRYPQTASGDDETPIEWIVLEVQDGKALLISKLILDTREFSTKDTADSWANSEARIWLNNDFMAKAFTAEEQAAILTTEVDNSAAQDSTGKKSIPGKNTQDKLFLLSYHEAFDVYFPTDEARQCVITENVHYERANHSGQYEPGEPAYWLLRSLLDEDGGKYESCVSESGALKSVWYVTRAMGIRPVFWLDLQAIGATGGFTFRNGVTWGMDKEAVIAAEGEEFEENMAGGFNAVIYNDVKVSQYTARLYYIFKSGRLVMAGDEMNGDLSQEMFDYLAKAYDTKYGEQREGIAEECLAFYAKANPEYTLEQVSGFDTCKWETAGDTQIWQVWEKGDGNSINIFYISPEYLNPEEEIDLSGI